MQSVCHPSIWVQGDHEQLLARKNDCRSSLESVDIKAWRGHVGLLDANTIARAIHGWLPDSSMLLKDVIRLFSFPSSCFRRSKSTGVDSGMLVMLGCQNQLMGPGSSFWKSLVFGLAIETNRCSREITVRAWAFSCFFFFFHRLLLVLKPSSNHFFFVSGSI